MARETEIKLRITDLTEFRRSLAKLGAARDGGRVHEFNILFDTAAKSLKKRGQLLRMRTESPATKAQRAKGKDQSEQATLTFKGPVRKRGEGSGSGGGHQVREELELEISDRERLANIFQALGMRPWFRYEKFRTKYRLPKAQRWAKDLVIDLDETPIGTFVELEGPASAIDRAAKALGFAKRDYIVADYFGLYLTECRRQGRKPGDMLFAKRKRRLGYEIHQKISPNVFLS